MQVLVLMLCVFTGPVLNSQAKELIEVQVGEITPVSVTQGEYYYNVEGYAAAYATDKVLSTGACTKLDNGVTPWIKLEFDKSYTIHKVVIYCHFYTNWYDPNYWCTLSENNFRTCVDSHSNVDVSVYKGEEHQKSCGTLQLSNGLEQSDQIYTLLCNSEGDTIKLSKTTGNIAVFEMVILGPCPIFGYYMGDDECEKCPGGSLSGSTSLTRCKVLDGYDNIGKNAAVTIDGATVTELTDLNLETKPSQCTAGDGCEINIPLNDAVPYGIHKVMLYAPTEAGSVAGWKVQLKTTAEAYGATGLINQVGACGDDIYKLSTGTDNTAFTCTRFQAANEINLVIDSYVDLAEVIIVGHLWNEYPCPPGYASPTGSFSTTSLADTCMKCAPGTYQDLEGQEFCRPARYSKLSLLDDNFATYFNPLDDVTIPGATENSEIHDIVIYNINFDDYSSTVTGEDPNNADGSCAASTTTYEAADCVLKIKDVTVEVGSGPEEITATENKGASRRAQTYSIKLSSPTASQTLTFGGSFLAAEIYVYGVERTEKYRHYIDEEGATVQKNCKDDESTYHFANNDGTACVLCPEGMELNEDGLFLTCTACLAGSYRSAETVGGCSPCETGHITAETGLGACTICTKGTKEVENTRCDNCDPGLVSKSDGLDSCEECAPNGLLNVANADQSDCEDCGVGKVPNSDRSGCKDCEAGTFRSSREDSCTDCPLATYTDTEGQSACSDCEMGQDQNPAKTGCKDCAKGFYRNSNVDVCTKCAITHVAEAEKTVDCTKCDPGYESNTDNDACVPCGIGLYRGAENESCLPCEAGYQTDGQTGQSVCVKCPKGKETKEITDSTGLQCVDCLEGFIAEVEGTATCVECQTPLVALSQGLDTCSKCELGESRDDSSTCTACTPGFFNDDNTEDVTCKKCPYNTYTDTDAQTECVRCANHTHSAEQSSTCTGCPPDDASYDTAINELQDNTDINELQWQKCIANLGAACEKETISGTYGTYEVEFMRNGKSQEFPCEFDKDHDQQRRRETEKEEVPVALFKCVAITSTKAILRAEYNCVNTANTAQFEALAESLHNEDSTADIDSTSTKLKELTGAATMGIGDVSAVADVIGEILPASDSDVKISEAATTSLVDAVSNLAGGDLKTNDVSKQVEIAKKMVDNMKKIAKSTTVTNKIIKSAKVAILKVEKPETDTGNTGITFDLPDASDLTGISNPDPDDDTDSADVKKEPAIAIETTAKSVAVVILTDDSFFPSEGTISLPKASTTEKVRSNIWEDMKGGFSTGEEGEEGAPAVSYVNSIVLEVDVGDQPPGFVLNLFIKPNFQIGDTATNTQKLEGTNTKIQIQYLCGVYQEDVGRWEHESCNTIYDRAAVESGVVCQCTHNTSFAVLMAAKEIDPGYIEAQSMLSTILLCGSIVGLILTVGLIIPASAISTTRSAKVNLCFSIALLLASILFVLQDFLVKSDNTGLIKLKSMGCAVYTILQHYVWLVVFMWTMIEGFLMYLSLVQVFGSHISNYMLKFNLVAWGVPIVFPLAGYFGFTRTATVAGVSVVDHQYMAETMCFLKPNTISFYALFFGPLVLAICINLVFFALVLKVIKNSKNANLSDTEQLMRQMKAAVGVMVLLGTGWIIGVFMNIPEPSLQITLQYVFIILNASQGMFVFVFYVLLNDAVKNFWLEKFGLKQPASNSASRSTTAGRSTAATNVYANASAKADDHTYSNAAEFPAKKDDNANL